MDEYVGLVFIGMWFAINFLLVVWVYRDAEARNQNGCLVGGLILFAGIPGIITWLLIRDNLIKRA